MTVGNRGTGKLQATTLLFAGNRLKSTVELGVASYCIRVKHVQDGNCTDFLGAFEP